MWGGRCQHDPKSGESTLRGLAVNLVRVLCPTYPPSRGGLQFDSRAEEPPTVKRMYAHRLARVATEDELNK